MLSFYDASSRGSIQRSVAPSKTYHQQPTEDVSRCGKLLPLANNGGPNMTHAIPHTSPTFNKGIDCHWERDQRYVKRDAKCDVGAFEFNDFTDVTITVDPSVKVDATGKALLTGTIKCTRDDTFRLALELHPLRSPVAWPIGHSPPRTATSAHGGLCGGAIPSRSPSFDWAPGFLIAE